MKMLTGHDNEPSGLEVISGISDSITTAPVGKLISAFLAGTFRDLSPKFIKVTGLLMAAPPNARIYTETGGTGHTYHTLKYRGPDPISGRSRIFYYYLGRLKPEELTWAQGILAQCAEVHEIRRFKYMRVDTERIGILKDFRKMLMNKAKEIADKAGYSFRGFRLLKRRAE